MVNPIDKNKFRNLLTTSVSNNKNLLTISKELEKQIKSVDPNNKAFTSSITSNKEKSLEEKFKTPSQRIRD